jgi:hypothetical protein
MKRQRAAGRNRRRIIAGVIGAMAIMTTGAYAKHGGGGLALPIIGGVAGGGLLTSAIYQQHEISQLQGSKQGGGSAPAAAPQYIYVPAQPAYAAPAYPAYEGSSNYTSIQGRLQELDSLCAQGLITPSQCSQRRQQIIDGL